MELRIRKEDFKALIDHAKRERPAEAVGILLGTVKDDKVIVEKIRFVSNVLGSPVEFHAEPTELYEAYKEAEASGLEVVGIFHSHPSPPFPSPLDMKFMKLNPVVWVITSTSGWQTRAYILKNELKEVTLKIMEKIY